jgi:hypothetical protein
MAKTWASIRSETLNLGFEKTKAYEKNKAAYVEAYNWRQSYIASDIGGILDRLYVTAKANTKRQVIDVFTIVTENGYDYVGLADIGVLDAYNRRIDDTAFVDNRFVVVPGSMDGKLTIYFYRMPSRITVDSPDDTDVEIPAKWANLMPYLMANRLYLDDDASKAGYYWNLYDDMRQRLLDRENMPTVTVVGNVNIDEEVW